MDLGLRRIRAALWALSLAATVFGPGCHRGPEPLPPLTGRGAVALGRCTPEIRSNEWATFNASLQGTIDHVQSIRGNRMELPPPAAAASPEARARDLTRRITAVVRPVLRSDRKVDIYVEHAIEGAMRAVEEQRALHRGAPGSGIR